MRGTSVERRIGEALDSTDLDLTPKKISLARAKQQNRKGSSVLFCMLHCVRRT
jgi:hypothetical protein